MARSDDLDRYRLHPVIYHFQGPTKLKTVSYVVISPEGFSEKETPVRASNYDNRSFAGVSLILFSYLRF